MTGMITTASKPTRLMMVTATVELPHTTFTRHAPVFEPGLRVTGHRVIDLGRVRSGHGSVWRTRCLTRFCIVFCSRFIVAFGDVTLESLGFCVLCIFTSSCLLAQILVICYFLVMLETFCDLYVCCMDQKLLAAHRRQNNLPTQSTDTQWPGRVTGSQASGSSRVMFKGSDPVPSLTPAAPYRVTTVQTTPTSLNYWWNSAGTVLSTDHETAKM